MSDYILDTDKTKEDLYEYRFKRIGLYHNSGVINTECKLLILGIWFLILFPLSVILRVFVQVTFSKTKSKCARILGWPSKFFYSGTNMLLIIFFQPFFIASIMELVENDFSTTYSVLSYTGSLFIILLTLVTFVAVWVMNMKAIC